MSNVKVAFGLVAQGHIPTIERMLKENADSYNEFLDKGGYLDKRHKMSSDRDIWQKIAIEIGWEVQTAMSHYINYLLKKHEND